MELADRPLLERHDVRGMARSKTCGSTVEFGALLGPNGKIADFGLRVEACAIGQAAAAIFAAQAMGLDHDDLGSDLDGLGNWLDGKVPSSTIPRLEMLEPAREHPARHGAILLPWQAALNALCS